VKHYKEKLIDLWQHFAEGRYTGELFGRPAHVERLIAHERTENSKADRERIVALVRPNPGLRVLDYGCGIGVVSAQLAMAGCAVTGADVSPEILAVAKARHPGIPFIGINEVTGEYDVIVSVHVLGVVRDPRAELKRMRGLLRPAGRLVFCLPNPLYTLAMIPNNMVNDYLPDPTVVRCWSRRRIIAELSSAGFRGIEIETFGELPAFFPFDALRSRLVGEAHV
jgi:2-polyprenyl-3-methyl-5-hydroxy-6-metoxy-1,4-benzoquinol methylase